MKQVQTLRQSASLIILAKNINSTPYDYKTLVLRRHSKSSFMPNSSVFPGGVCDAADSSPSWLSHFQRYDISAARLQEICQVNQANPINTNDETINSAVSLRLTALRETFEEMGILLCRDRKTCRSIDNFAMFNEQFNRKKWQHKIHNDATKFQTLCEYLDVLPDLWSLYAWSRWRTPSTFKTRFQTAFFVTALKQQPKVLAEPNEVKDYSWNSPLEYLRGALNKELWLPPPQFYELSRFLNFKTLEELRQFAEKRSRNECVNILPVQYKCTDGLVALFPGDDMYPKDPDARTDIIETGMSTEAFRALASKQWHRIEQKSQNRSKLIINFNPSDGQVNPLDPRTLI